MRLSQGEKAPFHTALFLGQVFEIMLYRARKNGLLLPRSFFGCKPFFRPLYIPETSMMLRSLLLFLSVNTAATVVALALSPVSSMEMQLPFCNTCARRMVWRDIMGADASAANPNIAADEQGLGIPHLYGRSARSRQDARDGWDQEFLNFFV